MLRSIGGAFLGYLALAFLLFIGLSAVYVAMGPDRAFRAGIYEVSPLWIVINLIVGFGAALAGGWVARRIARTVHGPQILAGIVVVLGLAIALPALVGDPVVPAIRSDALGPFEAMQQARTPLWLMLLNPIVGAIGALLGGRAIGAASRAETAVALT